MSELTLVVRYDQFELAIDALEYLKWKIGKERPQLGDIRDQSGHYKAGNYTERRIDELLESLTEQAKLQREAKP